MATYITVTLFDTEDREYITSQAFEVADFSDLGGDDFEVVTTAEESEQMRITFKIEPAEPGS